MDLSKHGKEYYELEIVTDPATDPTDWEASFDAGATWTDAVDVEGRAAWLVAGSLVSSPGNAAVLSHTTQPLVRLIANQEDVVRPAPLIEVY